MRPIIFFLLLFAFPFLISCEDDDEIELDDLQEEPEMRQELFNAIINDNQLMTEFMDRMADNPDAMHQLMMNQNVMQQMFSQQNMQMMQSMDPETMQLMMNNMMEVAGQDTTMENMMMNNPRMQEMMGRRQGMMENQ